MNAPDESQNAPPDPQVLDRLHDLIHRKPTAYEPRPRMSTGPDGRASPTNHRPWRETCRTALRVRHPRFNKLKPFSANSSSKRLQILDQRVLVVRRQTGTELVPLIAAALAAGIELCPNALGCRRIGDETAPRLVVDVVAAPERLRALRNRLEPMRQMPPRRLMELPLGSRRRVSPPWASRALALS